MARTRTAHCRSAIQSAEVYRTRKEVILLYTVIFTLKRPHADPAKQVYAISMSVEAGSAAEAKAIANAKLIRMVGANIDHIGFSIRPAK